jgi:hypothetical protein
MVVAAFFAFLDAVAISAALIAEAVSLLDRALDAAH